VLDSHVGDIDTGYGGAVLRKEKGTTAFSTAIFEHPFPLTALEQEAVIESVAALGEVVEPLDPAPPVVARVVVELSLSLATDVDGVPHAHEEDTWMSRTTFPSSKITRVRANVT
jgi:hypothetical protein